MAEAVWAARWLRGLAAEGKTAAPAADAEPASASAGNPVDPAPAGEPVAQVTPPATPAADAPWYVQCLLGLSAWLATLLLLLFIGLSQIVNTQEGALVAGLVLCAAGVAVLRSEAGPFWRQCGTAMAFAGELLVISEYQTPRHSPTPACSCWPWPWRCTCWVPISSCASSAAC